MRNENKHPKTHQSKGCQRLNNAVYHRILQTFFDFQSIIISDVFRCLILMNTRFKYNIYLVAWEIKTYIDCSTSLPSSQMHRAMSACLCVFERSACVCMCESCLILHKPTDDIAYRCISEDACIRHLLVPPQQQVIHDFISVGWMVLCHSNEYVCIHNSHTTILCQKGFHLYGIFHILKKY